MFPSCMDGSCHEAGELDDLCRRVPSITSHPTSQIQFHITLPSMSQLPVQWLPGAFSEGKVARTVA